MKSHERSVAIVVGLDGSGKSTTAQRVAQGLSAEHGSAVINVADSSGLYTYQGGELTRHQLTKVERYEPSARCVSKASVALHLAAFTLGRRHISERGRAQGDLLISVRDPHRIEPAVYSAVYARHILDAIPAERRLRFLDRFTRTPYADSIIQLACDSLTVEQAILQRSADNSPDPHETAEKLAVAASELPKVVEAYGHLFGTPTHEVAALQPGTVDAVAELVEPLVYRGCNVVPFPTDPLQQLAVAN